MWPQIFLGKIWLRRQVNIQSFSYKTQVALLSEPEASYSAVYLAKLTDPKKSASLDFFVTFCVKTKSKIPNLVLE